jgi:hypothetical protein
VPAKGGRINNGQAQKRAADARAKAFGPIIRQLMATGFVSQRELANELNRRGIPTALGGGWHRTTVWRMVTRLGLITKGRINIGLASNQAADARAEAMASTKGVYGDLLNLCVWNKSNAGMGSLYRSKHELVFVYRVGNGPHFNAVELGKHGRNRTNVWDYASVNSMAGSRREDLALHPTVKPTALVADAIQDVTRRGEVVLDIFLGSGTTLIAAERTGRRFRGVELDPAYVDVALERWSAMTGREPRLAEQGVKA